MIFKQTHVYAQLPLPPINVSLETCSGCLYENEQVSPRCAQRQTGMRWLVVQSQAGGVDGAYVQSEGGFQQQLWFSWDIGILKTFVPQMTWQEF